MGKDAYIKQLLVGQMANYCYLVGSKEGNEVIAIDPSWDPKKIIKTAEADGKTIKHVFLTHTHFDHIMALDKFIELNDADIYVHALEAGNLDLDSDIINSLEEGTTLNLAGLTIKCLHTPGHTAGSTCYLVNDIHLFTGDTLFIDSCGRVDLPESNPDDMVRSLARLSQMSEGTVVYPGHEYGRYPTSTIGDQRKTNSCFRWKARDLI